MISLVAAQVVFLGGIFWMQVAFMRENMKAVALGLVTTFVGIGLYLPTL